MLITIECDEIHQLEPRKYGDDSPVLEMVLDDINIDKLMIELAKKLDPEQILDYLRDDVIREYLG